MLSLKKAKETELCNDTDSLYFNIEKRFEASNIGKDFILTVSAFIMDVYVGSAGIVATLISLKCGFYVNPY